MTPERHQQIKQLFLTAVELVPAEAQKYLDSACEQDVALRAEVQSLLDHHQPDVPLPTRETAADVTDMAGMPPPFLGWENESGDETMNSLVVRPPGTIVAGRYRLVAPLGQGGMGVIYRAEDLELRQTVALKFLHPRLQEFSNAVELLRKEVRIARQVSHPNVVRVFDIGVVDGEVFISMEYVDGEDLGSLVRRVGRLPIEKTLQVARQMAQGLAAAHDSGVLHRDLKPTNVMIDGSGNVRILDFGIAAAMHDRHELSLLAGTPAFMAPELLSGSMPSAQSDLYAWGLIVYYVATGQVSPAQRSSEEPSPGAWNDEEGQWEGTRNATLDRLVAACVDPNPDVRPRSAHELMLQLSAGDPLAVELREGRIPSSGLLLASGSWQPSAKVRNALLAGGFLLLVLVSALADRTLFLTRCGLVKSPTVLQELAESSLRKLGYSTPHNLVQTGVVYDVNCMQYLLRHPELTRPWDRIGEARIPAVCFWYRQGDPRLPRPAPMGDPAWERMAQPILGTSTVRLDGNGRLLSLQVAVVSTTAGDAPNGPADWSPLFEMAGLKLQGFRAVEATRLPPLFAHDIYAWEGPHPAYP